MGNGVQPRGGRGKGGLLRWLGGRDIRGFGGEDLSYLTTAGRGVTGLGRMEGEGGAPEGVGGGWAGGGALQPVHHFACHFF